MNDRDYELFEAELRKLAPAKPPAELMAKLAAAAPARVHQPSTTNYQPSWWPLFRWLAPAAAVAAAPDARRDTAYRTADGARRSTRPDQSRGDGPAPPGT